MKAIIDTLKEIVKKDASTQTEPVTIIENEEDMTKVIFYGESSSPMKRPNESPSPNPRKSPKIEENVLSGIDHIEEEIETSQEGQIKSDASFYDRCKAYLDSFDFKGENYYSIKGGTQHEVITKLLPLETSIDSIFATNIDEEYTQEKKEENLKALVAGMYMAYTDLKADLEIARSTKDEDYHQLLSDVMRDRFGEEISGEVMDFLEHYGINMALHDTIIGNLTNANLNTPIGPIGSTPVERTKESASVFLRMVALVALTDRERNPLRGAVEWYHKPCSPYDCLFPFSGNVVGAGADRRVRCFPDRLNEEFDLNIANEEFGVVVPGGTTAQHYIDFMIAAGAVGRGATALGGANTAAAVAAGGVPSIPVIDENVTATQIQTIFNDYSVVRKVNSNNTNFFDEVNVVHNIHKLLARQNASTVRLLRGSSGSTGTKILQLAAVRYDTTLKLNVAAQGAHSLTIPLSKSGKLEFSEVGSWGAYETNEMDQNAFNLFKTQYRGGAAPVLQENIEILKIFRELYRLECMREPASLIANAMFVDLAQLDGDLGYQGILPVVDVLDKEYLPIHQNERVISYHNIRLAMPMAPTGPVEAARRLWHYLMNVHPTIYYKYDYPRYTDVKGGAAGEIAAFDTLKQLENNLLFHYIMHQADELDNAHFGAGNITARLRNQVFGIVATVQATAAQVTAEKTRIINAVLLAAGVTGGTTVQKTAAKKAAVTVRGNAVNAAKAALTAKATAMGDATTTTTARTQQTELTTVGNNPWQLVAGTSAIGVPPAAVAPIPALAGGILPAGVVDIYQVSVPVTIAGANYEIVFQARFRGNGIYVSELQATDIFITSFPLALINQLLFDWYQVDIGLPNTDIQIDLQLRL